MAKKKQKKKRDVQPAAPAGKPSRRVVPAGRVVHNGLFLLLGIAPFVFLRIEGEFENNPKMAFLQWGITLLALLQVLQHKKDCGAAVRRRTPLDATVLLFYVLCWASLAQAVNPWQSLPYLLHWGAGIIFYFYIVYTADTIRTVHRLFVTAALSSGGVGLVGICQKLLGFDLVPQIIEPASTFANPNMASQFVALCFPLALGAVVFARRLWMKCTCAGCLAASVLYLLYAQTRSAWMAVAVTAAVLTLCLPFSLVRIKAAVTRKTAAGAVALAVIACCIFGAARFDDVLQLDSSIQTRLASIAHIRKGTAGFRIVWWKNTVRMVRDNLAGGVGLGNFKLMYPLYSRAAETDLTFSDEYQLSRVHNDHLQILAELGLAGFCAYCSMFVTFLYLFGIVCRRGDRRLRLTALFVCLGCVSFIVVAFFSFPLERALPPVWLFSLFGVMAFLYATVCRRRPAASAGGRPVAVRACVALLLVAFGGASAYYLRAIIVSDQYFGRAVRLVEQGDVRQAGEFLQKAKLLPMWNFYIPTLAGRNHSALGDYDAALREYRESLRIHPNNINAILNIGYCHLRLHDYKRAEAAFRRFLEFVPDSPKAHNNLGTVYFSMGRYDRAIRSYRRAIELAERIKSFSSRDMPRIENVYAEPHMNLGDVYREQKRVEDAVREYERALSLKPGLDHARRALAMLYRQTGREDRARSIMEPLLQKNRKAAEACIQRAVEHQNRGRYAKALVQYSRALHYAPGNAVLHYNTGLMHYHTGNFEEAEKAFTRAVELQPDCAEAWHQLGRLALRKKDTRGALALFRKAAAARPDMAAAHFELGTIYFRLGDYSSAAEAYTRALGSDPGLSAAHYNLATIRMHEGADRQALYHFKQALVNPAPQIDVSRTEALIAELQARSR